MLLVLVLSQNSANESWGCISRVEHEQDRGFYPQCFKEEMREGRKERRGGKDKEKKGERNKGPSQNKWK